MRSLFNFRAAIALAVITSIMICAVFVSADPPAPPIFRVAVDPEGHMRLLGPEIKGRFNTEPRENESLIELPSNQRVQELEDEVSTLESRVSDLESRVSALEAGGAEPPPPGNENLVLWLPMDEGGGSVVNDMSGFGNDGVITGATWEQLPSGLWYLDFNGTSANINCGSNIFTQAQFGSGGTIKLWFNAPDQAASNKLIDIEGAWFILLNDDGTLNFNLDGSGGAPRSLTTDTFNDSTWHHLVATWDKITTATVLLFVDTTLKATSTQNVYDIGTLDRAVRFGSSHDGTAEYYDGSLALIEVYNRPWSNLEMQNSFNQEKHLFE